MREFLFGTGYVAKYLITGKAGPLICGLVLHNDCNLNCRHCTIVERPSYCMTYEEAVDVIDTYYREGGRCLYLEGGEPCTWKDGNRNIEDVIAYAKQKGYLAVITYTNGTVTLNSGADTIFVSIDGTKEVHDSLRGRSYERIMKNISSSTHPSIYVNYTINSVNKDVIEGFCKEVNTIPRIKGIFFYFHTPYYGHDDLFLKDTEKQEVIEKLLQLKKKYSILNSVPGLQSAMRNNWKKRRNICRVYENGKYYDCCRENADESLCQECGYLSYAEIDQVLKLKPGAIMNAIKYF